MIRGAALACALLLGSGVARAQASEPPRATLLYQNFPNPFPPTGSSRRVWFDLARAV